mmetsp:Transcript_3164/g.8759  ORF Transcript_3164/g.8759 Transcript_3164/m.8759 type:complete len:212 (+) Transcript_3164:496-1131(+)
MALGVAALVLGSTLQLAKVQVWEPTHEQLQLIMAEQAERDASAHLVEPVRKRPELLVDPVCQHPARVPLDVLLPVGCCHRLCRAARHQLLGPRGAVELIFNVKRAAEGGLHITFELQQLQQAACEARLHVLQVRKRRRHAQQLLVHDLREVDVEDDPVVDRQPEHNANQLKLHTALQRGGVEPKRAGLLAVGKHAIVRTEDVSNQQLEELA